MDIKELKLYTKKLDSYTSSEIDELELMSDKELDEFQYEIECGTDNTSDWDRVRAILTLRSKNHKWEVYTNQMKEEARHWKDDYYRMHAKYLDKERIADEIGVENRKMKSITKEENYLVMPMNLDYLNSIEKHYGELIEENARLIHFKEIATKYLTDEQLLQIEDEMDNIKETD